MASTAVGRLVRSARRRAGMTQVELASAIDAPQSTVARIELGLVSPKATTFEKLLRATGHELALERRLGQVVERAPIVERLRLTPEYRIRLAFKGRRTRTFDPVRILRRLRRFGVRFVLIGDLAAVAHGSPTSPTAVEICNEASLVNQDRLQMALRDLSTDAAKLRLVATPEGTDGFADLDANAAKTLVADALIVRVAALDDLIRIGRARRSPDLEMLGALREETDGYVAPAFL